MYGMVNKAVEDMVVMHHGEAKWEEIRAKAGVDVEVFIANEGYPDDITYRLVSAASEVLGLPANQILHAFGEHWILHTAREGYGSLLKAGGKSLADFLTNLPNFHARVTLIFPKLQPPRFACTHVTPTSLCLHYHTHRSGLTPFVVGLIEGLGKLYKTPVRVRQVERKDAGADHDVFHVTWEDAVGA